MGFKIGEIKKVKIWGNRNGTGKIVGRLGEKIWLEIYEENDIPCKPFTFCTLKRYVWID